MRNKTIKTIFIGIVGCIILFSGWSSSAQISSEEISSISSHTDEISYPQKRIIALGEATHGNKEFAQLKLSVFKQLIEQHDMRVFALEGDTGGSSKVNLYIQGGAMTAEQAVSEIGFAIYKTQEMVDIVEWMRSFNNGRESSDQIRFYGYDMQRFDNSKEGLFNILNKGAPELSKEYASLLDTFTNKTMYDLKSDAVKSGIKEMERLNTIMNEQKEAIGGLISEMEFALAQQYAECIKQNLELRISDKDYGTIRDAYMAKNVEWIVNHEEKFYNNKKIFITGHNGHIGKTTATVGTQKSMGELLTEKYGDEYFSIGTEFNNSTFLASDYETEERKEYHLQNDGEGRLSTLLHGMEIKELYLNMDAVNAESHLGQYFNKKQSMSSIGDMFADYFSKSQKFYTQKIAPSKAYNGIIFLDTLTPSTMLENK